MTKPSPACSEGKRISVSFSGTTPDHLGSPAKQPPDLIYGPFHTGWSARSGVFLYVLSTDRHIFSEIFFFPLYSFFGNTPDRPDQPLLEPIYKEKK